MLKLTIPGVLPGLNEYTEANRRNKYAAAKMKNQCEHLIMLMIKSQLRGVKLNGPVQVRFTWFEPNRCRDKDNIAFAKKFIFDAMVKTKLIPGDGWKYIEGFEDKFSVDKKKPRVEVEIEEIGDAS